jgi:quinol monooxygenase YgiN
MEQPALLRQGEVARAPIDQPVAEPARAEARNINYDLHRTRDSPDVRALYENWASPAALEAHIRGRLGVRAASGIADLLLTGRGAFIGDIGFPRQLHMRIVRSPYAMPPKRDRNGHAGEMLRGAALETRLVVA